MAVNLEKELTDLKLRVSKAETQIAQLMGSFEFISGQLRDVQRAMHAGFSEVKADVASLREDLPGIVTDAVRDVLGPG